MSQFAIVSHFFCGSVIVWFCLLNPAVVWHLSGQPKALLMTEDPRGVTSCGMMDRRCVISNADLLGPRRPVWCFSLRTGGVVGAGGGRSPERCLRLIGDAWRSSRAPQAFLCSLSSAPGEDGCSLSLALAGTALVSLSLFPLSLSRVHVCVHSPDPKFTPSSTPLWSSPSAWFPHTLSKPFNGF